ncbi:MAG: hypothetical protein Q7J06_09320, partial [Bacteroidales bacterium]|nr:hypothetical protein [Bacteroidales bacterium]
TFFIITIFFFLFTLWLNYKVDGYQLNTDRWSAMEAAIKALLNNEYPYSAIDHLNGRTSNLPGLIIIGIPFYLLGDVGYLQSFTFLLFVFLLFRVFNNYKARLFGLVLLISCASYGWEIYSKSDLISNFIIATLFVIIIQKRSDSGKTTDPILIAVLSASLLLTRLNVIIPLSLLLVKIFFTYSSRNKFHFSISAILSVAILLFIVFRNYYSFENLKIYNPFELQNRNLPLLLSSIFTIMAILYSFRVKGLVHLIKSSIVLLFIPILLSFALTLYSNGFYNSILHSAFDISYFNMFVPFLIIYLALIVCQPEEIKKE